MEGFQSLEYATFDFEGVKFAVVVGDSDVGKSAVVRAVSALAHNRAGRDFITRGKERSAVGLQFDDKQNVVWLKSSVAEYRVSEVGAPDYRKWEKTGRTVPEEVAKVIRLGTLEAFGEKFNPNIHGQFDRPFLVADPASTRAKVLGELSGINTLVRASGEAASREREAKRTRTLRQRDLEESQEELKRFEHLPKVKAQLEALSQRLAYLEREREAYREKAMLIGSVQAKALLVARLQREFDVLNSLPDVGERAERYQRRRLFLQQVRAAHEKVESMERLMVALEGERQTVSAELEKVDTCPVCAQPIASGEVLV